MHKIKNNIIPFTQGNEKPPAMNNETADAFKVLEQGVYAALETYSNVHRGSGHNSIVTTSLYEQARDIVLEYLGLNRDKYLVIFCSPRNAEILKTKLRQGSYQVLSCQDTGLQLGVRALAIERKALPRGNPSQAGGGTTRLVSPSWIIWADPPGRFEAGTPAIINIITFARSLQLIRHFGNDAFRDETAEKLTATEILHHDELEGYSGRKLLDELR
jgi:selenocysteine lyase/cysteine desulfurase